MKKEHATENAKFDTGFSKALRQQWLTMIQDWERDKSNPNPYTHSEKGFFSLLYCSLPRTQGYLATNLAEVRRSLAEADEAAVRQGRVSQQVPGSIFIRLGLEIEEQQ
jgi:hypothetical protein